MEQSTARIPQYPNTAPMKGTSIRISEKQRSNIDRIVKATNAQSIGASVRLLITAEITAVDSGQRKPADYIPTNEPKLYTIGLKLSDDGIEDLTRLSSFYNAPSISDTICHLLNQVITELEKVGD